MIYKTPTGEEISFEMKDMNTARARRDSYILLNELENLKRKHLKDGKVDIDMVVIDFIYPETDGKVECRYKELFEQMLTGELDKINYDLTDENSQRLMLLAMEVLGNFFLKMGYFKPNSQG